MELLSKQKGAQTRHGEDVRETLRWLDDATSTQAHSIALQGSEDHFEKWSDVEKFAVPRTLFSESDAFEDLDLDADNDTLPDEDMTALTLADITPKTRTSSVGSNGTRSLSPSSLRSQRSSLSAPSPPTSPAKAVSSPVKAQTSVVTASATSSASVPERLQSLFNYILWRIHQEDNPVAALESFIFLCNDSSKVNYAKGFEIRTKRLEQLREAIIREDKDFKNRQMVIQRDVQVPSIMAAPAVLPPHGPNAGQIKRPPTAPAAANQLPENMIDPDAFGRGMQPAKQPFVASKTMPSPVPPRNVTMPLSRGGQYLPFTPRGSARGNFRGGPRGRGNFAPGRGGFMPPPVMATSQPNQIDPNSFMRPRGSGYTGRGSGRKLWVPT